MEKSFSERLGQLADSVLDPFWQKLMLMNWVVRASVLLCIGFGVAAWQFPSLVSPLGKLVSPISKKVFAPSSALVGNPTALSSASTFRKPSDLRKELAPILHSEVDAADLSEQTAWSLSQAMVALAGLPGQQPGPSAAVIGQIKTSAHGDKFCWSELLHEEEQPCTYFVSGWVLSAFARIDQGVAAKDYDFLLSKQFDNGAWPMFEGGGDVYSSTYTTSCMIIGLSDQLDKGLVPADKVEAVRRSTRRAALWLARNQETSTRWKAFPNLRGSAASLSLSGLAIYALGRSNDQGLASIYRNWLLSLPENAATMSNEQSSYLEIASSRGTRIDHFVQFHIPWAAIATVDAMKDADSTLRERGKAFIRNALKNKAVTEAGTDGRSWWHAELLIGLRYLEPVEGEL